MGYGVLFGGLILVLAATLWACRPGWSARPSL